MMKMRTSKGIFMSRRKKCPKCGWMTKKFPCGWCEYPKDRQARAGGSRDYTTTQLDDLRLGRGM